VGNWERFRADEMFRVKEHNEGKFGKKMTDLFKKINNNNKYDYN